MARFSRCRNQLVFPRPAGSSVFETTRRRGSGYGRFGDAMSTQSPVSTSPSPARTSRAKKILVLDFGSQTAQLIARRVREQNVFCQMVRHDLSADRIREIAPKALILSGGPASVYEKGSPHPDPRIFDLGIPILGICYGMQATCHAWAARFSRVNRASSGTRPVTRTRPIRSSPMCQPTQPSG